jgi:hypothetical protein
MRWWFGLTNRVVLGIIAASSLFAGLGIEYITCILHLTQSQSEYHKATVNSNISFAISTGAFLTIFHVSVSVLAVFLLTRTRPMQLHPQPHEEKDTKII